jgi:hypothetical protein
VKFPQSDRVRTAAASELPQRSAAAGIPAARLETRAAATAFWKETRDRNACSGALYKCTNASQQPYGFSKIFAQFTG